MFNTSRPLLLVGSVETQVILVRHALFQSSISHRRKLSELFVSTSSSQHLASSPSLGADKITGRVA